jgi:predicted class III extradiol MEMO1 family dioxygenase
VSARARPLWWWTGGKKGTSEVLGSDHSFNDATALKVQCGLWRYTSRHSFRVVEVILVMGSIPAKSERVGKCLSKSSSSTNALLVIESCGWHVGHNNRTKGTDINSDLHRGGH